ncbi:hypothetical protein [Streptomyces sp. HPF1205]|uniref:hypothetical protein n=1 Tax=Streptomyces sp. HPF1205 TaxID=2873262 RepID=UPI001CEDBDBE|nr:hypothetical protein [Streptomyces sp. HPF1205]
MSRHVDDGGSVAAPLNLYPEDLYLVALRFAAGQSTLDTIATTLNTALQNISGMAGDDSYGHGFAATYDPAAKALFGALSAADRAIGQAATGLVTTANNYLKADHHSNPKAGATPPEQFEPPVVYADIFYPDPPSAVGPGHSSVPHAIAKYWPNGHQDSLRTAATAFRTASSAIDTLGGGLHGQVLSITDNNSGDSITAMADFWAQIWKDDADGGKAPLSTAKYACDQLAKACDAFAQAIDTAHSKVEHKLGEAGIAIGFTTAVGAALSLFTFGGSDAAAGALDAGEAAAILGEVEVALDEAVTTIGTEMIADLEVYLQAAADSAPELEVVDAETTEVSQALERELAETEARTPARTGGRGGGGGGDGKPPTGGNGEEPPPEDGGELSNRVRPPRPGDKEYVVHNPNDPSDTITDYDVVGDDGRLWEEKTATGQDPRINIQKWVAKNVTKKLDSYLRGRPYAQGYENASFGIDFTEPGATPAFRAAVEQAVRDWETQNGVDVEVRWAP